MRSFCAVRFAILLATFLSGCGAPVRENRQINFSADGTNVGFQHGTEGVFVAGGDGQRTPEDIHTTEGDPRGQFAPVQPD